MNTLPRFSALLLASLFAGALLMSCSQDESTGGSASSDAPGEPVAGAYPLTTCVVSGEPLGSMGEPYVHVHEGTTVKFCCAGCLDTFNENPAVYLAKLTEA
ncbi:MAG TPA: hypothetical protein VMN36_16370, partial [Verrucomicrobiales bacterium]|nr:hypothetical protein [Verrucomicrobiales bacterium]